MTRDVFERLAFYGLDGLNGQRVRQMGQKAAVELLQGQVDALSKGLGEIPPSRIASWTDDQVLAHFKDDWDFCQRVLAGNDHASSYQPPVVTRARKERKMVQQSGEFQTEAGEAKGFHEFHGNSEMPVHEPVVEVLPEDEAGYEDLALAYEELVGELAGAEPPDPPVHEEPPVVVALSAYEVCEQRIAAGYCTQMVGDRFCSRRHVDAETGLCRQHLASYHAYVVKGEHAQSPSIKRIGAVLEELKAKVRGRVKPDAVAQPEPQPRPQPVPQPAQSQPQVPLVPVPLKTSKSKAFFERTIEVTAATDPTGGKRAFLLAKASELGRPAACSWRKGEWVSYGVSHIRKDARGRYHVQLNGVRVEYNVHKIQAVRISREIVDGLSAERRAALLRGLE